MSRMRLEIHNKGSEIARPGTPHGTTVVDMLERQQLGWFWETDENGRVVSLSSYVRNMFLQNGQGDPIGADFAAVIEGDLHGGASRTLRYYLATATAFRMVPIGLAGIDPDEFWSLCGMPRHDADGRFLGFEGAALATPDRRRSDAAVARLAFRNCLTGLHNRRYMHDLLESWLMRSSNAIPPVVMLVDLDRFKTVNDTLGHQAGDELLQQAARRLEQIVDDAGVVGRLGGDEFQLVSDRIDLDAAACLAEALVTALSTPFAIGDVTVRIGGSIGIAIAPTHDANVDDLMRNADLALYAAKDAGRGKYRCYHDGPRDAANQHKQMEEDLQLALRQNQFRLVYQPIVATHDRSIAAFEAFFAMGPSYPWLDRTTPLHRRRRAIGSDP